MTIEQTLQQRAEGQCELCKSSENLSVFEVTPNEGLSEDCAILACENCIQQMQDADKIDVNHWRCLNDSMWSQIPAVQVVAWRMLTQLSSEGWPQDFLDMLYLDDDTLSWAKAGIETEDESAVVHKDAHGAVLNAGDTVTLIKDLNVKGANFTAKRGTAVRGISLVADHADQIEGRVSGQQIVILTQFVKKSN